MTRRRPARRPPPNTHAHVTCLIRPASDRPLTAQDAADLQAALPDLLRDWLTARHLHLTDAAVTAQRHARPALTPEQSRAVAEAYRTGTPIRQITDTFRTGRQTVLNHARKHGVPIRPAHVTTPHRSPPCTTS